MEGSVKPEIACTVSAPGIRVVRIAVLEAVVSHFEVPWNS